MQTLQVPVKKAPTFIHRWLQRRGWGCEPYEVCSEWTDVSVNRYTAAISMDKLSYMLSYKKMRRALIAPYTDIPLNILYDLPEWFFIERLLPVLKVFEGGIGAIENVSHKATSLTVDGRTYSFPVASANIELIRWITYETAITKNKPLLQALSEGKLENLAFALAVILSPQDEHQYNNSSDAIKEREAVMRKASLIDGIACYAKFDEHARQVVENYPELFRGKSSRSEHERFYYERHGWGAILANLGNFEGNGFSQDKLSEYLNSPIGVIFNELVRRQEYAKTVNAVQKENRK